MRDSRKALSGGVFRNLMQLAIGMSEQYSTWEAGRNIRPKTRRCRTLISNTYIEHRGKPGR
jgi:hypothetical protein